MSKESSPGFEIPNAAEIEVIFEKAGNQVRHGSRRMHKKVERIMDDIEEFVHDELKEFFAELE